MGMLFVCWVSKTKNTIPTLIVGRQTRGRRDLVDGNWTRLVSEARWTKSDESQMPCGRVAIGLKGASVQRSAAAFVRTREANQGTLRPRRTHTGIYL